MRSQSAGERVCSRRSSWIALAMLTALYTSSLIDRSILALLMGPIKVELGISDSEAGLLYGFGFGLLYALIGIPAGQYIDRSNRVLIVIGGGTLWGLCTLGSAWASGLGELLLLRSGLAAGEAVLTPAAISIIGDLFPSDRRALPTAIYSSAGTIVGGGALLLGTAIYDASISLSTSHAPLQGISPWRISLFCVGALPLVLIAIFAITVREPQRRQNFSQVEEATYRPFGAFIKYVRSDRRLWCYVFALISLTAAAGIGYAAWAISILTRQYHLPLRDAGYLYGGTALLGGMFGSVLWPALSRRSSNRSAVTRLPYLLACGGTSISVGMIVHGVSATPVLGCWAVFLGILGIAAIAFLPLLFIQLFAPHHFWARLAATNLLAQALVGGGIGPLLVGYLADNEFSGPKSAGYALASVGAGIIPLLWLTAAGAGRRLKARPS